MGYDQNRSRELLINIRKLAALDIVFYGARLIIAEFALSVIVGWAVGLFIFFHEVSSDAGLSLAATVVGAYALCIGLNYVPLLYYACAIARHKSAHEEVARELADRGTYVRKYRVQQFLLLVPVAVLLLAVAQSRRTYV